MSAVGIRSLDGSRLLGEPTILKWNDLKLIAKTVRCSDIILRNVHFHKGDEEWIAPLQISSSGKKVLTEHSVVVVPPDNKDVVEFIFFNGNASDCRHFQLDRQAKPVEFSPTAEKEILIDIDKQEGIKHLPWDGCTILPHEGVLEPRKLKEGAASSRKLKQASASQT